MVPARLADKPHYVFHPVRLARRVRDTGALTRAGAGGVRLARLPWGLDMEVYSREAIGYSILNTGVFDPCVTETLHRLIDRGDVVVDVGANVGYLTGLAAMRAGANGSVTAYEPHPAVYDRLAANAARWNTRLDVGEVVASPTAVTDRTGYARLAEDARSDVNMGLATLHAGGEAPAGLKLREVSAVRLDEVHCTEPPAVLKVDVEGHELEVLTGARGLLEARSIRDIVFEDHHSYPDPCTELLEGFGYTLFALHNDLRGLRVSGPAQRGPMLPWPGPSYLATVDPDRALGRLRVRGWQIPGIGLGLPRP